MPIGMHGMVVAPDWTRESCRRAVATAAAAGYDLVEIPLVNLETIDAADTRRVLDEHGIGATCSTALSPSGDIASDDPVKRAAGRSLLHRSLEVTAAIGAGYLGGVLSGALAHHSAPVTASGRAASVEVISGLCAAAAQHGVTIGLEAVNRFESNFINTAEQALAFADAVAAPNCAVHLDSFHMNIEETDLAAPVERVAHRLACVHIGESHRGRLGTGTVNFAELFGALKRISFDGPITFETFSRACAAPGLETTLGLWHESWGDGAELAAHARNFIDDFLRAP
jgi:D-psicose/D-tagatose/L-ribulose 3-epimerase